MYAAPDLEHILADMRASVQAETPGTDPWIWPNNLVPVLKAFAQAQRAGYLRLEFVHAQAFVTTARGSYLDWHGIQAGGLSRNPATYATGPASAPAMLGTVIPDGTLLARSDGAQYQVVGTTTAVVNPVTINVRAIELGELGNTDAGASLYPVMPLAGIDAFIVGDGGVIGGHEGESDDSFRQRILFHKQNPPHGGSPAEYVEWCMTKQGVTRVFVKRATPERGAVTIYFMMDGVSTGIPFDADVDELTAILDVLAPSDADVIVEKPVPLVTDVVVGGLVPDTPAMRDAVVAELKAMFMRRAEPASVIETFTFSQAWLHEAAAMAPGWRRSRIVTPAADVVATGAGEIPVLGTVSFVA